jgi:hypothetical protein
MGEVVIPWARGRKMFISYDESGLAMPRLQQLKFHKLYIYAVHKRT